MSKSSVLLDSNVLIYSALDHPEFGKRSTRLLINVELKKIEGYIPTIVLNETLHRLMIAEVIKNKKVKNVGEALSLLRNVRKTIPELDICWTEINKLFEMNFIILKEKRNTFLNSLKISKKYSLLARDACIASFAQDYGIKNIATFDKDFERVEFLKIWRP
ncbi:MAG: type II toxin-antitoxin system VapC family toxin [Euryarchaeota archaeon]|nr:type II toxin-antitoxin system VapC family toxin [Euryarchaeota archaeon]